VERDFPGRVLVFRLGIILGPHEDTSRLTTWLERFAGAGSALDRRVLAPGDPARPMHIIDARDIALFGLHSLAEDTQGTYIVAGTETIAYGDWLRHAIDATHSPAELVWADDEFLIENGVSFWTEMPLWSPADHPEVGHAWDLDASRAVAAGLRCRPVRETVFDTWTWLSTDEGRARRTGRSDTPHGLDAERERALLAAWDARG
jgi:2'-hydroxyisoflavone reductase